MAEYDMQESNLPNEEGKRILFPRMRLYGQNDLDAIVQKISYASSFTPGDIKGLVRSLADEIAYQMGQGHSVKIDGIGVFSPSLSLRDGYERESGEPGATKRNAMSTYLNNVNFRADKELIENAGQHCILNRTKWKFQHSSQMFSPQERLKMAQNYLTEHPFMTVSDYCHLTGLLHNSAARELKHWSEEREETGIDYRGRGSHKIYVKR